MLEDERDVKDFARMRNLHMKDTLATNHLPLVAYVVDASIP